MVNPLVRIACLGLLLVLAFSPPGRADDDASAESRIAALTRRVEALQEELAAVRQELAALRTEPPASEPSPLRWIRLADVEHLEARLRVAAKERRPTVVLVGAPWCTYSRAYQGLIDRDPALRKGFEGLVRLEIDVGRGPQKALRRAAGLGLGQPKLGFYDARGEPVPDATIDSWLGEESAAALARSLRALDR